jgi:hypothetical protein
MPKIWALWTKYAEKFENPDAFHESRWFDSNRVCPAPTVDRVALCQTRPRISFKKTGVDQEIDRLDA